MMFTRQETDLKRLLAMLLIFACLLCAGCEGAEGATRETKSDTSVSQSGETITDCKDCDYSRLRECRINLHDGRQVTCLILSGDIRSGMSCDWANAKETE
ncbi:hypothetical protein [Bifidobacterium longum]|nr:hypothetical protein [Bifidobacterium longum]